MTEDNQRLYTTSTVLNWYKTQQGLSPAETVVFDELKEILPGYAVLDIGIGSGRTTSFLSATCKSYVGIDYSPRLLDHAIKLFPKAHLQLMDARNLSDFSDATFDLVNFSFNGIDYVSLTDRQKIMIEIHRVLKPGGIFFFSTHNRAHRSFNKISWLNSEVSIFINLKTFLRLFPFFPRHFAKKKNEIFTEEYAVINDSAHSYGLLTFYTTPLFLNHQLIQSGFTNISLRTRSGKKAADDLLDSWIFVTCNRSVV